MTVTCRAQVTVVDGEFIQGATSHCCGAALQYLVAVKLLK